MQTYALAALLVGLSALARAEVPMHNPGLDSACPKGFQYSRDTASCKQAFCPPGAGRVDTLECNCGEAWGRPFRTCYADGLASHCVAAGQPCDPDDSGGFDALTGACQLGYTQEADGTCAHAFPRDLTCAVVDARGQPLAGREVTFGEAGPDPKQAYQNTQHLQSGADGRVTFRVADPKTSRIVVQEHGAEGRRGFAIERDRFRGCVIHVVDEAGFEAAIRDGYEGLLRDACVSDADLAKVREIGFQFSGGGKPMYAPDSNAIEGISVADDYEETVRAMIHELSHGMIAQTIDGSKDVGGKHNNWVPVEPADVKGRHGTPEALAFEEGAADFVAMLYFRMRGQVYQADLADDTAAGRVIEANGKPASARTESIVTRYLWSVYQPIIEGSPDGPARALADFMRTMTYAPRQASLGTAFTDPTRTVHDFIAARIQRDTNNDEKVACGFARVDLARARALADAYGFVEIPRTQTTNTSPDALAALAPGDHDLPADSELTFQDGARFLGEGKLGKTRLGGKTPARFRIEADGKPTLLDGTAVVSDGAARTDALDVVPTGTGYVVRVADGAHTVAVDHGQVEVAERDIGRAGGARRVTLAAGQAVDFTAAGGFSSPRAAREDLARAVAQRAPNGARGGAARPSDKRLVALVAAIALGTLALGALWLAIRAARRRRTHRAT